MKTYISKITGYIFDENELKTATDILGEDGVIATYIKTGLIREIKCERGEKNVRKHDSSSGCAGAGGTE